jgi:uncharacterized small protein (DUF1192 family)
MTEPDVTFELAEKVAALTAENARLRGEVDELRSLAEQNENQRHEDDCAAVTGRGKLEARIAALTADLARVTAERDGLLTEVERLREELTKEHKINAGYGGGGQTCATCGKHDVGDYANTCGICKKNLCDDCMRGGHCGHVPALDAEALPPGATCGGCQRFAECHVKAEAIRCSGFGTSHFVSAHAPPAGKGTP